MAVYVEVHWFNENGQNIAIDDVKVTDTYSRRKMESSVKNYRFDDLWINRAVENKVRDYINRHSYHKYFTAVAIDNILLNDIFILPEQ